MPNHVRIIDGDSIDAIIGGNRVAIGLIGIRAPQGNTNCGRRSKDELEELGRLARGRGGGPRFVEDKTISYDDRGRRMYYLEEKAGRSLAREMVKGGWAHADGRGKENAALAAEEAAAKKAKRGCLWGDRAAAGSQRPADRSTAAAPAPLASARDTGPAGTSITAAQAAEAEVAAAAAQLPAGFTTDTVASGLGTPTSFALLPDGRILVAQQNGVVRLVKDGVLQSAPFIDISSKVNNYWDRGLLGIAADANFATNGFVYLLYTYEDDPATYNQTKTSRLSRVTATGDVAAVSSERTILGSVTGSSCRAFPVTADCLPSDYFSHSVGSVKSASDGTLYLTVGESASWNVVDDLALRAQDLNSLAGKVLHVTSLGQGLATNPHYTGDVNANASKVWASGLRNPYRMNLKPGTDVPFLGDVGWNIWEEINAAPAGANFGWPCYEGTGRQSGYESKQVCQALYARGAGAVRPPVTAWNHNGSSAAATGGVFYTGTSFPEAYRNAYFYGDYAAGFIRYLKVDANNQLVGQPVDFATGGNAVDIEMGLDGHLYVLDIFAGELQRIRYGAPDLPPPPTASAYLSDLPTISDTNGWGPVERDMSNGEQTAGDGVPQRIQGVAFARGLGVHAGSDVRFNLGQRCTRFRAQFGVDDEVPDNGPSVTYTVLADGTALATGSANGVTAAQPIDVDVSGRAQLQLVVGDGGDGNSWDHADWADANLVCSGTTTPPQGSTYLSDLTPTTATNGWGPYEKDQSNGEQAAGDGRPLTIQGTTYARGLGVHADSSLRYALNGSCTRFTATVGVDDETVEPYPSVRFTVSADGAVLFDSGVMSRSTAAQTVDVSVAERATLALEVDDVDGNSYDHADWADAKLTCRTGTGAGSPPVVTMAKPTSAATYKVGDVITYSATATDAEDGTLPASALTWKVLSHHCPGGSCHVHTILTQTGVAGGSFTAPDHGDESYLEFQVTATDRSGATGTASVSLQPQTVALTLATSPAGLKVVYDGTTFTAPVTRTTIVGSRHTIGVPAPQGAYAFRAWSDGGAREHEVVVGATAQTLTASFSNDTVAPTVSSVAPASGATGVALNTTVVGQFSEAMTAATVTGNTVRLVRNGTSTPVTATVSYDATTRRVTLRPSSSLVRGTTYTATIVGGATGVKDLAGNAMTTSRTWSFTTIR